MPRQPNQPMKMVVGIDPGINGGYAALWPDGSVYSWGSFPLIEKEVRNKRHGAKKDTRIERYYDLKAMKALFEPIVSKAGGPNNVVFFLELVASMPRDGVASAFKFGDCFGALKGLIAGLGCNVILVTPRVWQSSFFVSPPGESKIYSLVEFKNRFPSIAAEMGKKKPHSGVVDGALIAEYGRKVTQS